MTSPSERTLSSPATGPSEANLRRSEALGLFPLESLQYLDRDSAVRCQAMLGHGDRFGVWETPSTLIGRRIWPSHANINLRERLIRFLPNPVPTSDDLDELVDAGVLWLIRYALLCRMGPAANGKGSSIDASSLVNDLISRVPKIVAMGIDRRLKQPASDKDGFVNCLTVDDLNELRKVRHIGFDLKRLTVFTDRGL